MSRFQELQAYLRQHWQELDAAANILVVPSLSLDQQEMRKIPGSHHYEERLLFSLIRLRNPRARMVYVTSQPLHPSIIDYYLELLPGMPASHARERLLLLSTYDASNRPLTEKILERPRLLARLRQALPPGRSFMVCFNSTPRERDLSVALDIPLWGLDPDLLYWGTKAGSREIFAESGVPHPDGTKLVFSPRDLVEQAAELWARQPHTRRLVVKLNEGFSGEGNALLTLPQPPGETHAQRVQQIWDQLPRMRFQCETETWENFAGRIEELGAIAEVFIEGENKRSPSVQGQITPAGTVEILSTHDQILGGPDGQIYLGCRFPADPAYQAQLQTWGLKIGQTLAAKGALERYGVDFVACERPDGTWDVQAIEINLRKGGTTHPFMTLKFLTNGTFDPASGLFLTPRQHPKYYIATDNLQRPHYRGLLPSDLLDIIVYNSLHFDSTTETGAVFHLMGCLSEFGKLGLTCIGDSPSAAQHLFDQVVRILDEETNSTPPSGCHGLRSGRDELPVLRS
ncbi:MAG: peptide ligase PGM1-related protein [Gloeomargarita sp. SKYG116]|nr:peptide ligase PGM1-related protein [Gloeomargarita sp. SKYG116]MCS7226061.1 peptide ligase PGM1-related protein [Gloeomargarita sp. SKYB31]MDW8400954.1 peptide ligase PGM1-related protein [Gloeomargarita sp. SKYGB_i_bin116]